MQDPPRIARRCPSPNARYVLLYGQMLSTYSFHYCLRMFSQQFISITLFHSLSHSLSLSLTHSLSLSHTHTPPPYPTHTLSHTPPTPHSHTPSPTLTLSHTPPTTLSDSLPHSHSVSLTLISLRQVRSKALWSGY